MQGYEREALASGSCDEMFATSEMQLSTPLFAVRPKLPLAGQADRGLASCRLADAGNGMSRGNERVLS